MNLFFEKFPATFLAFVHYLPSLFAGIACFFVFLLGAKYLGRLSSRYSLRRTKDGLIANFIGKVIWTILFILGCVLTLGILGLGTVSNKILAGAGITTFVIGFALKDIGENFLSGLIIAFSRPFHVGSLIECDGIKGIVKDMTMRQTTVEAENERIVLIPNSSIIKNALTKYSHSQEYLRQEFAISVEPHNARHAAKLIADTISGFEMVIQDRERAVKIIVDALDADKVKLLVIFWLDTVRFKGSRSGLRSEIMLSVFDKLREQGYAFSG